MPPWHIWLRCLLVCAVAASLPASAQPVWVNSSGSTSTDLPKAVATDATGVYVVGQARGQFDADGDGTIDVPLAIFGQGYVLKYDLETGDFEWIRGLNSEIESDVWDVAAVGPGVFATGQNSGSYDFDGDGADDLTVPGDEDYSFLTRYDADGQVVWARQVGHLGSPRLGRGLAVAEDGAGGAYVAGDFEGALDFDGDGTNEFFEGGKHVFVSRHDRDGALLWGRLAGETLDLSGVHVDADAGGSLFMTKEFEGFDDFDGDGEPDLDAPQGRAAALAKFTPAGDLAWLRSIQGTGSANVDRVAADEDGGVYVVGFALGTLEFGDTTVSFDGGGVDDGFVARYDADGALRWVRRLAALEDGFLRTRVSGAALDPAGGVFVTGSFESAVDFDEDGVADAESVGGTDIFLARYDAAGSLTYLVQAGGPEGDGGEDVAVGAEGVPFVAGFYWEQADFDGDGTFELLGAGAQDVFAARYAATPVAGEPRPDAAHLALTAYPNPASQGATVAVTLPEATDLSAEVYDVLGRRVAHLHRGALAAGTHAFPVDIARWPAGLYVIRIGTPEAVRTHRLTVTR